MNDSILFAIDRALAACMIDFTSKELTKARIRLAMLEVAQAVLNDAGEKAPDATMQERMDAIEKVLISYVGCTPDRLVVRHIDLLRQQPVDLDKLMLAVGGVWEEKVRAIATEEADRKQKATAYVDRHASAAPVLGFRDAKGNKITEEAAKERVRAVGGSAE